MYKLFETTNYARILQRFFLSSLRNIFIPLDERRTIPFSEPIIRDREDKETRFDSFFRAFISRAMPVSINHGHCTVPFYSYRVLFPEYGWDNSPISRKISFVREKDNVSLRKLSAREERRFFFSFFFIAVKFSKAFSTFRSTRRIQRRRTEIYYCKDILSQLLRIHPREGSNNKNSSRGLS